MPEGAGGSAADVDRRIEEHQNACSWAQWACILASSRLRFALSGIGICKVNMYPSRIPGIAKQNMIQRGYIPSLNSFDA